MVEALPAPRPVQEVEVSCCLPIRWPPPWPGGFLHAAVRDRLPGRRYWLEMFRPGAPVVPRLGLMR